MQNNLSDTERWRDQADFQFFNALLWRRRGCFNLTDDIRVSNKAPAWFFTHESSKESVFSLQCPKINLKPVAFHGSEREVNRIKEKPAKENNYSRDCEWTQIAWGQQSRECYHNTVATETCFTCDCEEWTLLNATVALDKYRCEMCDRKVFSITLADGDVQVLLVRILARDVRLHVFPKLCIVGGVVNADVASHGIGARFAIEFFL